MHLNVSYIGDNFVSSFDSVVKDYGFTTLLSIKSNLSISLEWLLDSSNYEFSSSYKNVLYVKVETSLCSIKEAKSSIDLDGVDNWTVLQVEDHVPARLNFNILVCYW
jgi:hypothetical protein